MGLLKKICFWKRANYRPSQLADADAQMQKAGSHRTDDGSAQTVICARVREEKEGVCSVNQQETQNEKVLAEIDEFKKLYIADT
jgi:hypothetical protein